MTDRLGLLAALRRWLTGWRRRPATADAEPTTTWHHDPGRHGLWRDLTADELADGDRRRARDRDGGGWLRRR